MTVTSTIRLLATAMAADTRLHAATKPLDVSDRLSGSVHEYVVRPGDSLTTIGARAGVGNGVLAVANDLGARPPPTCFGAETVWRDRCRSIERSLIMVTNDSATFRFEEPLAELERQLIRAYVAAAGHDVHALLARDDEEARRLLAEAVRYASVKLSEVEARSHYVRALHGDA